MYESETFLKNLVESTILKEVYAKYFIKAVSSLFIFCKQSFIQWLSTIGKHSFYSVTLLCVSYFSQNMDNSLYKYENMKNDFKAAMLWII